MTGRELLAALQALPDDALDLPVCSLEENWYVDIKPPKIITVDSTGEQISGDGERIIAL